MYVIREVITSNLYFKHHITSIVGISGLPVGHVAALVRSHMNCLTPFKGKYRTNNRTNAPNPKTKTATTIIKQ